MSGFELAFPYMHQAFSNWGRPTAFAGSAAAKGAAKLFQSEKTPSQDDPREQPSDEAKE